VSELSRPSSAGTAVSMFWLRSNVMSELSCPSSGGQVVSRFFPQVQLHERAELPELCRQAR